MNRQEVLSILYVGFVWGITNPFVRKGSEEAEKRMQEEEEGSNFRLHHGDDGDEEKNVKDEEGDNRRIFTDHEIFIKRQKKISYMSSGSDEHSWNSGMFSYGSTCTEAIVVNDDDDGKNDKNNGKMARNPSTCSTSSSIISTKTPIDESTCILHSGQTTRISKHSSPDESSSSFSYLSGIIRTLRMFKNIDVAIPFLFNQTSAIFYYRLVATSDLTSAAYCNALSMVVSAIIGHFLGERFNNPRRAIIGSIFVVFGVALCMASTNIEESLVVSTSLLSSNSNHVRIVQQSIRKVLASKPPL